MNILSSRRNVKHVFSARLTNEWIDAMPRRPLTAKEAARPYAWFYFKNMTPIPQDDLDIVNAGLVDPAKALSLADRNRLLEEDYLPCETGYWVMPDGSGFAATKVLMKGVAPTC